MVLIILFLLYEKINFNTLKNCFLWGIVFFLMPFFSFPSLIVCSAILFLKLSDIIVKKECVLKQKIFPIIKTASYFFVLLTSAFIIYKINFEYVSGMNVDHSIGYFVRGIFKVP